MHQPKDRNNIVILVASLIEVSLFEQAELIIQSYLIDFPVDEELNNLLKKTKLRSLITKHKKIVFLIKLQFKIKIH